MSIYKDALRLYWLLRALLFTKPKYKRKYTKVEMSVEELRVLFGRNHFTNNWEFSYNYRGEDLNMRRPLYKDNEYEWYQLHVRGWEKDGYTELYGHTELEPSEYPKKHKDGEEYRMWEGMDMIEHILDEEGVPYSREMPE